MLERGYGGCKRCPTKSRKQTVHRRSKGGSIVAGARLGGTATAGAQLAGAIMGGSPVAGALLAGAILRKTASDLKTVSSVMRRNIPTIVTLPRKGSALKGGKGNFFKGLKDKFKKEWDGGLKDKLKSQVKDFAAQKLLALTSS